MSGGRRVYYRGNATIEFPFLLSCAVFLLDRRFWILGIRYPLKGIRFDLLAKIPSIVENVMLVEAKFRGDGRPVRPYEMRRFIGEVSRVKAEMADCIVRGYFMTNTRFSERALKLAISKNILTFHKVPLLFELKGGEEEGKSKEKESENAAKNLSSRFSNRAGRRGHS